MAPSTSTNESPRPEELAFLQAIVEKPTEEGLWLILADWLEENDDPRRAELLRLHRQLIATCCEPDQYPERARQQARLVELLTAGVRPSVPRQAVTLGKAGDMAFHFIPPGSFLMGSPSAEELRGPDETLHRVTLTQGFWLAVTPVTQAQWRAVMGSHRSRFKGVGRPVERVSWLDCQVFCRELDKWDGRRFRLPTEAEWEYACRAGTTTPFFFGETLHMEQANFDPTQPYGEGAKGVYRKATTEVGSFPCNAWGLFDMHGNVYEWCQDYSGRYPKGPVSDPQGPKRSDSRVLRGGSWFHYAGACRSASRVASSPGFATVRIGFRPVLLPE